tara:strand:+ start:2946 stop:3929 length:984 start_codon:yes stop_codon:yes gene_type:complete
MRKSFHVIGIGNAIIDILSYVDDTFLKKNLITKGVMNLVSSDQAEKLLKQISISKKVAGGSAANTIVGLSQLGFNTSYIGKVCDDKFGNFFSNEMKSNNVKFEYFNKSNSNTLTTGLCIVLVTPDGERTMNTHLGVTEYLSKEDLDINDLQSCEWLYLEGYRFDGKDSQIAFNIAIDHVKYGGGKVALSLSDPFCVERHRSKFLNIIKNGVDLIFCNEKELISLTGEKELNSALLKSSNYNSKVICTVAERGVFINNRGSWINIPTKNVKIKDTTGAGDLFATGFLYGLLTGSQDELCSAFANKCAGEVIKILGCRLEKKKLINLLQ